jgi:hypothetical protein
MNRKSGYRFSEKIMLNQKKIERDDNSKKSHPASVGSMTPISSTSPARR